MGYGNICSHTFAAVIINIGFEGSVFGITEGNILTLPIVTSGFSYGAIPVVVSLITYSEYMDRGFNLTDEFLPDEIPVDAATGKTIDT